MVNIAKISKKMYSDFDFQHNPRLDDQFAVKRAFETWNLNAIRCLLKVEFVDFGFDNNYPIRMSGGNIQLLKVLIENPSLDPGANNNEALRNAAYFNRIEAVELLLTKLDPRKDQNEAFVLAVQQGHHDLIIIMLRDDRVDPTSDGRNLAWTAAIRNNDLIAVKILEAHIPIPPIDFALRYCIMKGDSYNDMFQLLTPHPIADIDFAMNRAIAVGRTFMIKHLMGDGRLHVIVLNTEVLAYAVKTQNIDMAQTIFADKRGNPCLVFIDVVSETKSSPIFNYFLQDKRCNALLRDQYYCDRLLRLSIRNDDLDFVYNVIDHCEGNFSDPVKEQLAEYCTKKGTYIFKIKAIINILRTKGTDLMNMVNTLRG